MSGLRRSAARIVAGLVTGSGAAAWLRRIGVGAEPSFVFAARLAGVFDEEMRGRLTGIGRAA